MSVTQTLQHAVSVLRRRAFMPATAATAAASDPQKAQDHTLGCSCCFPYSCECESHTTRTHAHGEASGASDQRPPHSPAAATGASPTHQQPHTAHSTQQQGGQSAEGHEAVSPAPMRELKPKQASVAAAQQRRRSEQLSHAGSDAPPPSTALLSTLPACTRCMQPFPSPLHTTLTSNAANPCRFCKVYTSAELASHHSIETGLWLCIASRVYDLTAWAPSHPGGLLPLQDTAGADCTDVFRVFHSEEVALKRLPAFQIGIMGRFDDNGRLVDDAEWKETPMQKDFHSMVRQLEADGMFDVSKLWYLKKVLGLASLLFLAVFFLVGLEPCALYIATSSALLGFFWQQLAFIGHDLGHNSVVTPPGGNAAGGRGADHWLPGLLVTSFFGVSVQWWKRSHNVHHVVTNSLEHDCDIQYLPVFALSERMLKPGGFFSSYHAKWFKFDWVASKLVRWQHVLYWPVMGVARANLYVQSIGLVWDNSKYVPHRTSEKLALLTFWTWHVALLWSLPDWSTRLAYYTLAHHVAGLTHVQITLSHFAMPVHEDSYTASSAPEAREHFLRSQFATTMDVDCSEWMDWLHGGLQFQLAHHLLPRVPRHHLREVREKYVKPFAKRNELNYQSETFWEANKTVYRRMKTAALASRDIATQSPFTQSILGQFLRSEG